MLLSGGHFQSLLSIWAAQGSVTSKKPQKARRSLKHQSALLNTALVGWYIKYIDKDPETIARKEALAKKEKMEASDEVKTQRRIEAQMAATAALVESENNSTNIPLLAYLINGRCCLRCSRYSPGARRSESPRGTKAHGTSCYQFVIRSCTSKTIKSVASSKVRLARVKSATELTLFLHFQTC